MAAVTETDRETLSRGHRPYTTIISFDPGGRTGWSLFRVNTRAFTVKAERLLGNIESFQHGEFSGPENEQVKNAFNLVKKQLPLMQQPFRPHPGSHEDVYVVTENFDNVGTIGGAEVLSPVRINAALDFVLWRMDVELHYQPRSLRLGVTKERLDRWIKDYGPVRGKDAFAATQHAVVFMRRLKKGLI